MQTASSPYPFPPYYQSLYHIQPLAPQDHDLKRQYLTLLPPQQIIEICLTFDVHVSPYVKSTIWPQDLHSAITNLRKVTDDGVASMSLSQGDHNKSPEPIMASLGRPPQEPHNSQPSSSNTEVQITVPQLSDKPTKNSTPTTSASLTSAPASTIHVPPPILPQPPYPHQPYGYPSAAYPHAPYYPPPPGYPSYPASSYPPYPSPFPNGYLQSHPVPPMPHQTGPPNSMYHVPQPVHPEQGPDDLPSYEEMIVEALQEFSDPEGCAPKDLFASMAAKYPLQSNFRPSASQALQKAFKRGRLEKGNNGKYRLSATWEGGSTSRRTTRRPQTQTQQTSAATGSPGPPFTHAPLIHEQHSFSYPGYPYPYPYPGYAGYPQPRPPTQPQPSQPTSSDAVAGATDKPASSFDPSSDVDKDAYEAAQNILKAINFGDLLQIASESGADGKKSGDVSVDQLTSLLVQAQNVMSAQMDAVPQVASSPGVPLPTLSATAGVAVAIPTTLECPTNIRAELQAQLALLAAQLAELSQEREENINLSSERTQAGPLPVPELRSQRLISDSHLQTQLQSSKTSIPPFLDALPPLPDFSLSGPQPRIQEPPLTSVSQTHPENWPNQQHDDVSGDQVLEDSGSITTEASTSSVPIQTLENSVQTLPGDATVARPLSLEVASGSAMVLTTPTSRLKPPLIFPAPDSTPAPELSSTSQTTTHTLGSGSEPHAATPNFVEEETDSEDDDMEEIA